MAPPMLFGEQAIHHKRNIDLVKEKNTRSLQPSNSNTISLQDQMQWKKQKNVLSMRKRCWKGKPDFGKIGNDKKGKS
jgi:hypothetical protein